VSLQPAAVIFFVVWTMKADPNKGCAVQLCVGESSREPITPRGFGTPPVRFGVKVCFGSSMRVLDFTWDDGVPLLCTQKSQKEYRIDESQGLSSVLSPLSCAPPFCLR
jgi:hypothetical protein